MNDVQFRQAIRDRMRFLNRSVRKKQENMLVIRDNDSDIAERKLLRRIAINRAWLVPDESD